TQHGVHVRRHILGPGHRDGAVALPSQSDQGRRRQRRRQAHLLAARAEPGRPRVPGASGCRKREDILMRVLVIEDELALRESLVTQLKDQGFNVDAAADGEEGLYLGQEYTPDVAIVDLGLPKLSGLEVIKRLRANNRSYPILILTARDRWQDKVEGLQ